jgi:uracil-DNA glycosylase family 4
MTDEQQLSLFNDSDLDTASAQPPLDFDAIPTNANAPIPRGTYDSLEPLTHHCQHCQRCELCTSRTHAVVGRGNPHADILLIGEGPGQNEDEQGLPFVGKSGQLLEKILASVQLDPERDLYISNMVKCRPPGNRTPTPKEIEACKPYLLEQIRLVDPKIILFTGATALRGLTGDKRGITKVRGQWIEWEKRHCMAIFHPAYLLRNPSRDKGKPKWLMWQDIQEVRAKLEQLRSSSL